MATLLDDKKLKLLVKESVKEALGDEFVKIRALLVPFVSPREQKGIEKQHGQPNRKAAKAYRIKI